MFTRSKIRIALLSLLGPLFLFVASPLTPHPSPALAADHAAANETIWPSQNDIAQTAGDGKKLLENQWAKPTAVFAVNNYSLTGLTVPASDADLNINVALGTAYIAGRHINIPAATSVTATASTTNFVFLKLTRDGSNLVTGASFEVNTTGTPPADSTPIATLTAGASSISATTDLRIFPSTITVVTSGTSWTVPAGITRVFVEVYGAGGGGGGGEGGDGGAGTPGTGTAGGNGGTTSFDTLSATGGTGGKQGGGLTTDLYPFGVEGVGSGGILGKRGGGMGPGVGGAGGTSALNGAHGWPGESGGYEAGYKIVSPGTAITVAIGSAGTAGSGGSGVSGGSNGAAGTAGQSGLIAISY